MLKKMLHKLDNRSKHKYRAAPSESINTVPPAPVFLTRERLLQDQRWVLPEHARHLALTDAPTGAIFLLSILRQVCERIRSCTDDSNDEALNIGADWPISTAFCQPDAVTMMLLKSILECLLTPRAALFEKYQGAGALVLHMNVISDVLHLLRFHCLHFKADSTSWGTSDPDQSASLFKIVLQLTKFEPFAHKDNDMVKASADSVRLLAKEILRGKIELLLPSIEDKLVLVRMLLNNKIDDHQLASAMCRQFFARWVVIDTVTNIAIHMDVHAPRMVCYSGMCLCF